MVLTLYLILKKAWFKKRGFDLVIDYFYRLAIIWTVF